MASYIQGDLDRGQKRKSRLCRVRILVAVVAVLALAVVTVVLLIHLYTKGPVEHTGQQPPNVVFILVDDLGYNDISWNNPEVHSPRLEALAREGVILDQNYMHPVCSPSRGAIMTGMYSHHIGLNHGAIMSNSPECARRTQRFLPEKLRELGYTSHLLGKWHLGFCNWNCTPTYRGFNTFYGFYQSRGDHYQHTVDGGFDWRAGTDADFSAQGHYSTDLITNRALRLIEEHDAKTPMFMYLSYAAVHSPLAVPKPFEDLYPHVKNPMRRVLLGMVSAVDQSVGLVVDALQQRQLLDSTIIIFSSDNGAQFPLGSNAPLRGAKNSIYEGGTRVPGFIYGRGLSRPGHTSNGLIHASDWFPTIVSLAGGDPEGLGLDGVDQTGLFFANGMSGRTEIIYNIDTLDPQMFGAYAIRRGDYKLILGYPGLFDGWEQDRSLGFTHEVDLIRHGNRPHPNSSHALPTTFVLDYDAIQTYSDELGTYTQLYNVRVDPGEHINLASRLPNVVRELRERLVEEAESVYPIHVESQLPEPRGNPQHFHGVWTPGWC